MTEEIRQRLAKTLDEWMRQTPHLDTQMKVSAASGVGQTTVGRILNCRVSATLDVIHAIATAFDRDPAELLITDGSSQIKYDRVRYKRLPEYERARVEAFIRQVIDQNEAESKRPLNFRRVSAPADASGIKKAAGRSPQRSLKHHETTRQVRKRSTH